MAKIDLRRVEKRYGDYVAVETLDLSIVDGEFLVMLGPSGCGKTTTLNMIAGLDYPSAGEIFFDGQDVTAVTPHARNVAMVFQSSLLYPHLTVRRNIESSLRHTDLPASEKARRITEAVRMLELEPMLDKLPSQMSGGQRQRAATAKAIVREPSVFLLDEPLSALDAALRLSLRSELVNLQKRLGTTAVFVTHDQVEAMTMGDRIAVMSRGRLEQIGTPDEIYNQPASLFVAAFLGSPPMNLIAGEIAEGCFRAGRLSVPVEAAPGPATLGVRPQHARLADVASAETLPATVYALEHLGRESVVILEDEAGMKLRVLVEPSFHARVGDKAALAPDPSFCMLFGADGLRLPVGLARAA
ncbi:sn-glycerol 3-phosphate transport system ATP-binding protein [Arboricoccus pini]|uniref:sn-glycerol 3-phosphate transport system ATP-binding protein n=1 Tax=Arboricoccus pini TaxID=1963835 RepID=A0A212RZ30_9PROT|nr:ABC transporter ATP-binding protein [Arboricoccus pini]SNB77933.1 sn-glycerol 3-phosphate transport system ATP-binding protein [Arboricoccus pini]